MAVQERYDAKPIGVNTSVSIGAPSIGGFLAKTGGTISIVNSAGVTIVDAHPVSAGGYYPLPFTIGSGGTFTTADGASGTIAC
jgi:hypothetical protein